jgi:hypothetical protein
MHDNFLIYIINFCINCIPYLALDNNTNCIPYKYILLVFCSYNTIQSYFLNVMNIFANVYYFIQIHQIFK